MHFSTFLPVLALTSAVTADYRLNERDTERVNDLAIREALIDAYIDMLPRHLGEISSSSVNKRGSSAIDIAKQAADSAGSVLDTLGHQGESSNQADKNLDQVEADNKVAQDNAAKDSKKKSSKGI